MCKYKTLPEYVDADQFVYEENKTPEFIPKGVYEKVWKFNTGKRKDDTIMKQWVVDGMFGIIKIESGDWVVKRPTSKYYEVFKDMDFHKKFDKCTWEK